MRQHIKITSIVPICLIWWFGGIHICEIPANVKSLRKLPLIQMKELDFLFCFIDQWGRRNDILPHSFSAGVTSAQPAEAARPTKWARGSHREGRLSGFMGPPDPHPPTLQMRHEVSDLLRKHLVADKLKEPVWQVKSDHSDFYIKIVKHCLDRFILIW